MSFFNELKRRNVFKVTIAYIVVAWLVAQVLQLIFESFGTPDWVMKTVLVLMAAGLAFAIFFAWAFEMTPEGIRKDSKVVKSAPVASKTRDKLHYAIIGLLALAASYLFITGEHTTGDNLPSIDTLVSRPLVVVLPFANISGNESQDYLAFGITDELITGLQRLGNFPVLSRNASLSYGMTEITASEFAQNHGASYLVEGSVNVGHDGIRILANLSSAQGNQVWAERYQLENGNVDIFNISDELVSKVAGAVMESEVKRIHRKDRPPSDAWEHYIKGLKVVLTYDHQAYETARKHLDQAIEIAPEMAEAWWALGELEVMNYMTKPLVKDAGFDDLYVFINYFRNRNFIIILGCNQCS